jgi:hypothetical protein
MLVLDGGTARTVPTIPNPYRQAGCQARNGHCFSCGLPVDEQLSVAKRHVYWSKLFDTRTDVRKLQAWPRKWWPIAVRRHGAPQELCRVKTGVRGGPLQLHSHWTIE